MGYFYMVFWRMFFCMLLVPMVFFGARADDMAKQMEIASLKKEISELETELEQCQRSNKGWRTATWIGAAGTVATGTAAIVQGVKLHKINTAGAGTTTIKQNTAGAK